MLALLASFSLPAAAQRVPSTRIITQAELDAEKQKAAQTTAEADKLRQQLREAQFTTKYHTNKFVEKVVTKEVPDPKTEEALRKAQEDRAAAEQRERQAKAEADARASEIAALKKQLAAKSTAKAAPQPAPAPGPIIVPASQPTNAPGQPGSSFKACTDCPEVVWLPQGNYLRGSPESDIGGVSDERPVRKVTIAYTLAAGKYPVTFKEWDACVDDGACPKPSDSVWWNRNLRPVTNISYDMITYEYLPWLNKKAKAAGKLPAGYQFALPTESEREYFARGITNANEPHPPFPSLPGTRWADGNCVHTDAFNYNGDKDDFTFCGAKTGVNRKQSLPVNELHYANRFGLFGVAGNVWELTRDCSYDDYNQTPDNGDPAKENNGCSRVKRGGSWFTISLYLRAAKRGTGTSATLTNGGIGFRVVLSPRI